MNANGVTSRAQGEISPERILLGRLALLSREGNHRAVAEMLADYFVQEMPAVGPSATGIRERRRDSQTNPLYLALAELPLDLRIVNVLEQHFGALYVIDLERYRWPDDFLAVPQFGPGYVAALRRVLESAGAWKLLERRRHLHRRRTQIPEELKT
ncbi:MAG TPA: hypothetical protein VG826_04165 [Pirellulales bacterium]|nr:hypothetical protein [Pirellulales bacterium]